MKTESTFRAAIAVAVLFSVLILGDQPSLAQSEPQLVDVVREWNDDGSQASSGEVIGWSKLVRREKELRATVRVEGLVPGGL